MLDGTNCTHDWNNLESARWPQCSHTSVAQITTYKKPLKSNGSTTTLSLSLAQRQARSINKTNTYKQSLIMKDKAVIITYILYAPTQLTSYL